MTAIVQELGGAEKAAEKLRARNNSPMMVAIEILGGVAETAEKIGISKQALYNRLKTPLDEWPHGYLRKISEMSGVSLRTLTSTPYPCEALEEEEETNQNSSGPKAKRR